MKVARHGFDPGIGHPDQRTAEIGIGKSNGLEHGARPGPVASLGDSAADVLEIHSERLQDTQHGCETASGEASKIGKKPHVKTRSPAQKRGKRRCSRLASCITLPRSRHACQLQLEPMPGPLRETLRSPLRRGDVATYTRLCGSRRNWP